MSGQAKRLTHIESLNTKEKLLDAMVFRTLSGFYQENPANCPRPTRPLTVLVQFAVIVAILCDLLIRVAHTLEYPARVSKIAWVEAVVFS